MPPSRTRTSGAPGGGGDGGGGDGGGGGIFVGRESDLLLFMRDCVSPSRNSESARRGGLTRRKEGPISFRFCFQNKTTPPRLALDRFWRSGGCASCVAGTVKIGKASAR